MNFTKGIDNTQIEVELKYCERCGGLFLRPYASHLVYCATCEARQAALASPPIEVRRRASRTRRSSKIKGLWGAAIPHGNQRSDLQGTAVSEVRPC